MPNGQQFFPKVRSQGCAGRLQPINVYDEMDWIANRSRAELRATLEQIIRQERDNLVMKLNRCGSLSRPQSQHSYGYLVVLTVFRARSVVQRYGRQVAE